MELLIKTSFLTIGVICAFTVRLGAQSLETDEFIPIQTGNYWEFILSQHTYDVSNIPIPSYYSEEILGDSILNGAKYWYLSEKGYDVNKELICERLIGVVVDSLNRIDTNFPILRILSESCNLPSAPFPLNIGTGEFDYIIADTVIQVAGMQYSVSALAGYHYHGSSSGGAGGGTDRFYAAGIGLVYHHYETRYHWSEGGGFDESIYELSYAVVNNSTYGIKAVSNEDILYQHSEIIGEVTFYPNPFHDAFYISLNDRDTDVDYELYDILGRLVSSGDASERVAVPVGFSGIYLIQLRKGQAIIYRGSIVRTKPKSF